MQLDLSPFLRGGVVSEAFGFAQEMGEDVLGCTASVTVTGRAVYLGESVVELNGMIQAGIRQNCDRCLIPAVYDISVPFCERISRAGGEDIYAYSGEALELTEMVREHIVLHLPLRVLCKQDCKGICPVCGCDLNNNKCSCAVEDGFLNQRVCEEEVE